MRVDKEWNVLAEDRISVDLVQRKDVLKVRKRKARNTIPPRAMILFLCAIVGGGKLQNFVH